MPNRVLDYRTLTVAHRIELIGDVWNSVIADGWRPPLSDELRAELERRIEADKNGEAEWIPWEEVKRAARFNR